MAQETSSIETEQMSVLEALASLLRDCGYKALIELDQSFIRTGAGGLMVSAYPDDLSVQLRCGLIGKGLNIGVAEANGFNERYRFCKLYLDKDQDVVLESDFLFRPLSGDAKSSLTEIMSIFENSISLLKDFIVEYSAPKPERSPGKSSTPAD